MSDLNTSEASQPLPASNSLETPQKALESPISPIPAKKRGPGNPTGANGGGHRPKGIPNTRDKRTYDAAALAEVVTTKLVTGRKIIPTPRTGPISEDDRALLARIAGVSVEAFNEMFSQDLREVSVLATARMKEKLLSDQVKPEALAFMMTSATDKRLALDGSRALSTASVNIQVNNYGPQPKDALLSELDGLGSIKQAVPVAV